MQFTIFIIYCHMTFVIASCGEYIVVFSFVLIYIRILTHSHNSIGKQLVHVNYLMLFLL
jgi:hypothetical protein